MEFEPVDFLGSAASGALAGSAAGLPGAIVGGLVGGAISIFGKKKKKKPLNDPFEAQRNALIAQLSASKRGEEMAGIAARKTGAATEEYLRSLQNDPNLAGNIAAQTAAYNKLNTASADTVSDAFAKGKSLDDQNKSRAIDAMNQAGAQQLSIDQYNQEIASERSSGEAALSNILTIGAGQALGGLLTKQFSQASPAPEQGGGSGIGGSFAPPNLEQPKMPDIGSAMFSPLQPSLTQYRSPLEGMPEPGQASYNPFINYRPDVPNVNPSLGDILMKGVSGQLRGISERSDVLGFPVKRKIKKGGLYGYGMGFDPTSTESLRIHGFSS
jgi:hypothetical protein